MLQWSGPDVLSVRQQARSSAKDQGGWPTYADSPSSDCASFHAPRGTSSGKEDPMMFKAHTWRLATCLVFLLSRTASTASAFLEGELPRFGVKSRCISTSFASGGGRTLQCSPWGHAQPGVSKSLFRQEYMKSSFQLLQKTPPTAGTRLLALRHADFSVCFRHGGCCCFCILFLEVLLEAFKGILVVVSRVDCASLAPRSSAVPDVVPQVMYRRLLWAARFSTRGARKSHGSASTCRTRSACHRRSSGVRFTVRT